MKKLLLPVLLLGMTFTSFAQNFSVPLESFSRKKTAYLHMEDGTIFEGLLGGFKRAKGLIETVKMQNDKGKKLKIDPLKINYMYIPPSGIAKVGAELERATNASKWEADVNIDKELMDEGYVYFEKQTTQVKKKTEDLMLQLLNASFSNKIKVYHDPFAKETMSAGIGGVTFVGGLDKSYYVMKVGVDDKAYKLEKKNYKEQFATLFGDCQEFMNKYKDDIKWSDLEMHIYDYSQMCK